MTSSCRCRRINRAKQLETFAQNGASDPCNERDLCICHSLKPHLSLYLSPLYLFLLNTTHPLSTLSPPSLFTLSFSSFYSLLFSIYLFHLSLSISSSFLRLSYVAHGIQLSKHSLAERQKNGSLVLPFYSKLFPIITF